MLPMSSPSLPPVPMPAAPPAPVAVTLLEPIVMLSRPSRKPPPMPAPPHVDSPAVAVTVEPWMYMEKARLALPPPMPAPPAPPVAVTSEFTMLVWYETPPFSHSTVPKSSGTPPVPMPAAFLVPVAVTWECPVISILSTFAHGPLPMPARGRAVSSLPPEAPRFALALIVELQMLIRWTWPALPPFPVISPDPMLSPSYVEFKISMDLTAPS